MHIPVQPQFYCIKVGDIHFRDMFSLCLANYGPYVHLYTDAFAE